MCVAGVALLAASSSADRDYIYLLNNCTSSVDVFAQYSSMDEGWNGRYIKALESNRTVFIGETRNRNTYINITSEGYSWPGAVDYCLDLSGIAGLEREICQWQLMRTEPSLFTNQTFVVEC